MFSTASAVKVSADAWVNSVGLTETKHGRQHEISANDRIHGIPDFQTQFLADDFDYDFEVTVERRRLRGSN